MNLSKQDLKQRWAAIVQIDRSAHLIAPASHVRGDSWAQTYMQRDFEVAFPVISSADQFMREFRQHTWSVGEAQEFGVGLVVAAWLEKRIENRLLAVKLYDQARQMAHMIGLKREKAAETPALLYLFRAALGRYAHGSPHLNNRGLVLKQAKEGQLVWESIPMAAPASTAGATIQYARQCLANLVNPKQPAAVWAEDCEGHFLLGYGPDGKALTGAPIPDAEAEVASDSHGADRIAQR